MDPYIAVLAGFGVIVLLTAWLPMVLEEMPLSLPIACVAIGALVFSLPFAGTAPRPIEHRELTERATELVVIVALMGAGLKLDRPFGWRGWIATWRLIGITMPLSIAAIALLGWWLLGLDPASALLLGAVLAPTDPVLASDVQVGPPGQGQEDEVRLALTSEAGLNDGLAFPFVNLAIALGAAGTLAPAAWAPQWLAIDVAWKLAAGAIIGWAVGRGLGWLTFRLPNRARLSRTGDGFVALGVTCLAYGLAELAQGYGFLAVFLAALALRATERHHDYHERLHDFAEQTERLLMMVLLVVFGGALAEGLLRPLDGAAWLYAGLTILLVRPLAGWIGLVGSGLPKGERAVMAFYGIRGLGSAYYLAFALGRHPFDHQDYLWAVVGLIVLVSILLHGTTVTPVMRRLDRKRGRALSTAGPAALSPSTAPSPRSASGHPGPG